MLRVVRKRITVYLFRIIYLMSYLFPLKFYQKIGGVIGLTGYYFIPKYRNIAIKNVKSVLLKNDKQAKNLVKKVFINQAKNFFELLQMSKLNRDDVLKYIEIKNIHNLKNAFEKKKGVILLTAHFGNWELIGAVICFYKFPLNVIARKIYIDEFNQILIKIREKFGEKVILRGEIFSAKYILKALKKGEIIAMLIDQNTKSVPGIYVNFLNKIAYTPIGPAAISLRSKCSLVPAFIYKNKNNKHTVEFLPEVELIRTNDYKYNLLLNTQKFNKIIEKYIQNYPEQWVWFHNRWD